jgi:hypothetical protein
MASEASLRADVLAYLAGQIAEREVQIADLQREIAWLMDESRAVASLAHRPRPTSLPVDARTAKTSGA